MERFWSSWVKHAVRSCASCFVDSTTSFSFWSHWNFKGKLAIKLFKSYRILKKKPYLGNHFWSRGYFVNTVVINEDIIRRYVQYQEEEEKREEAKGREFTLFDWSFKERLEDYAFIFLKNHLLRRWLSNNW